MREAVRPLLGLDPADVPNLPADVLPSLLATLAALQAAVAAQLAMPSAARNSATPGLTPALDHWLTPDEAASLASVPRRTVYGWSRRQDWRAFTRRLSKKVLRIEERGFRRWLDRQLPR